MKRTNKITDIPLPLAIAGGLMIVLAAMPAAPGENAEPTNNDQLQQEQVDDTNQLGYVTPKGLHELVAASLGTPLLA